MKKTERKKQLVLGILFTMSLVLTPILTRAATPDADFAARCSASGVVKCWSFDNTTTDIVQNVNLWPAGDKVFRAGLDTAVKVSGAGSLRFTLPPPPHSGANIAGKWEPVGNDAYGGRKFGQNSTFYTQFRMRISPEMLTNTWDSYWKFFDMEHNQSKCGTLALVFVNRNLSGMPAGYTQCGARGLYTNNGVPPTLLQQGDYNCQYGNINSTDCFSFAPNEWMTFYFRVQVGTWDQPNSWIQAWVAREGWTSYKQWINLPNFMLTCSAADCTTSPGKDEGFNNSVFFPYMSFLSSTSGLPGVTSYMWIDEFVISTQPIALPGSVAQPLTPPAAPTNLRRVQ